MNTLQYLPNLLAMNAHITVLELDNVGPTRLHGLDLLLPISLIDV